MTKATTATFVLSADTPVARALAEYRDGNVEHTTLVEWACENRLPLMDVLTLSKEAEFTEAEFADVAKAQEALTLAQGARQAERAKAGAGSKAKVTIGKAGTPNLSLGDHIGRKPVANVSAQQWLSLIIDPRRLVNTIAKESQGPISTLEKETKPDKEGKTRKYTAKLKGKVMVYDVDEFQTELEKARKAIEILTEAGFWSGESDLVSKHDQ